jgi:folate-dependent phosphoribosylglycinamide formyltransferase PurN
MRNPSGIGSHPEQTGEVTGVEAAREKARAETERRGCLVRVVNGGVGGTTIVGESAFGCSTYWF